MGSYRAHIPQSYEEEMEQLRIALELSASTSTRAPGVAQRRPDRGGEFPSTSRPVPTREAPVRAPPAQRPSPVMVEDVEEDFDVAADGIEKHALSSKLRKRHGISQADADNVVDMLDGNAMRANDVCVIMAKTKSTPTRAVAWLRNVGWDVDLALGRMTEGSGTSPDVERERAELRRRAEAARKANPEDKRTIKQDLNGNNRDTGSSNHFSRAATMNGGSASFGRASTVGRDSDAERYQRDRWEREMRARNAEARRADVGREKTPRESCSTSQNTTNTAASARQSAQATPLMHTSHQAAPPSIEILETKGLIEILKLVGIPPSSSTAAAVRSAYKKAALQFHPDRTVTETDASKRYKCEVWKLLSSKMEAYHA